FQIGRVGEMLHSEGLFAPRGFGSLRYAAPIYYTSPYRMSVVRSKLDATGSRGSALLCFRQGGSRIAVGNGMRHSVVFRPFRTSEYAWYSGYKTRGQQVQILCWVNKQYIDLKR